MGMTSLIDISISNSLEPNNKSDLQKCRHFQKIHIHGKNQQDLLQEELSY